MSRHYAVKESFLTLQGEGIQLEDGLSLFALPVVICGMVAKMTVSRRLAVFVILILSVLMAKMVDDLPQKNWQNRPFDCGKRRLKADINLSGLSSF